MQNNNWSSMTYLDKIEAAERMYGTSSKQHLAAIKKFTPKEKK